MPGICKPPPCVSGDSFTRVQSNRAENPIPHQQSPAIVGGCRVPGEVLDIQKIGNQKDIPMVMSGKVALQIGPGGKPGPIALSHKLSIAPALLKC